VTLVFTDIEGSTQLLHELGETYGQVLDEHHRLLREVWTDYGGVEEGTLAFAAVAEGNYDDAEERLQAILARPQRTDFAANGAMSYLADSALGRGDGSSALTSYASALETEMRNTDPNCALLQLVGIAASLAMLGRDSQAALMLGAVERVATMLGTNQVPLLTRGVVSDPLAALAGRLGHDQWERQRTAGRELSLEQAVEVAFELAGWVPGSRGAAMPRS
jgi:class 3 adenylate cyclase